MELAVRIKESSVAFLAVERSLVNGESIRSDSVTDFSAGFLTCQHTVKES